MELQIAPSHGIVVCTGSLCSFHTTFSGLLIPNKQDLPGPASILFTIFLYIRFFIVGDYTLPCTPLEAGGYRDPGVVQLLPCGASLGAPGARGGLGCV